MKEIIPKCEWGGRYLEGLAQELSELISDHDSFVKIEALETFSETIEYFQEDFN